MPKGGWKQLGRLFLQRRSRPLHAIAWHAAHQPAHLQHAQCGQHPRRLQTTGGDDVVDVGGRAAAGGADAVEHTPLGFVELQFGRMLHALAGGAHGGFEQRPEFLQNVIDPPHQRGTVADQIVAALRQPAVDRTRHSKDIPPLLQRQPGGDQGPRAV